MLKKKLFTVLILTFSGFLFSCTDKQNTRDDDSLPEPWASLNLEIDGALVTRASESELQLKFPHISAEKQRLAYAMITMKMKEAEWKKIEEDYGKEGEFESPAGKKYGIEVFPSTRGKGVVATIWRK